MYTTIFLKQPKPVCSCLCKEIVFFVMFHFCTYKFVYKINIKNVKNSEGWDYLS